MSRQVLVVGAGPAGLAAAETALRAGAHVTLVDASEQVGGQYHRMPPEDFAAGRPGLAQRGKAAFDRRREYVLGHARTTWCPETSVWALERLESETTRVHTLRGAVDGMDRRRAAVDPDALVLAPGAHDRVLPFPGWTLPGVYTAGAAQALVKGERVLVGDRVVISGTGPFLLPVAASLLEGGARVLAVLEANRFATVSRGWTTRPRELVAHTAKVSELAGYAVGQIRHRVPYRMGRAVIEARGDGRVEEVVTARLRDDWSAVPGSERVLAADAVCVGHGFSPRLELPVAAGCTVSGGFVAVDGAQRTSQPDVFAAGEVTGIAGAPSARDSGAVAGWIAGGGDPGAIGDLRTRRDRGRAFGSRLARAHPIGTRWVEWLRADTPVCRCEGTDLAAVRRWLAEPATAGARSVRLGTRAGLGPCQARVCGPTISDLAAHAGGEPSGHHRPIAQPIRLGELADDPANDLRRKDFP